MKKIFIFSLASILGMSAFSQESGIKQYGFWDNWFVQVQGGASYTISEDHMDAKFTKMVSPSAAISVGKILSPEAGIRLQAGGWESKSFIHTDNDYYKRNFFQVNLDGMLNLTNTFLGYRESRPFNLYGILGAGYVHGFKKTDYNMVSNDYLAPRAGVQADFRLSNALSLNLEVDGTILPDDFNGRVYGNRYDIVTNAMLGLTFHLPQRGFKVITSGDPDEIKRLNDQLNERQSRIQSQQGEIDQYKNTIASLQNQLAKKPQKEIINTSSKETVLNAVVVFRLGSAALEQNQEINIYNAAKYLKENPNVNVVVTGYADKSTGTPAINQQLSEKRAQAVADILTNKYGISSNRIKTEASGDKVQPFETDEWNRVVIFTADK